MKRASFQRRGLSLMTTVWNTETHQETTWGQIKGRHALHTCWRWTAIPPLNYHYITPPSILQGGTHRFWRHESAVSPLCPAKQQSSFLLHPKLCLDWRPYWCMEAEFQQRLKKNTKQTKQTNKTWGENIPVRGNSLRNGPVVGKSFTVEFEERRGNQLTGAF